MTDNVVRCVARIPCLCGEGPVWVAAERSLYWIDCLTPALHRINLATGRVETVAVPLPPRILGLVPRATGGFVVVGSDGLSFLDHRAGTRDLVCPLPDAATIPNDGACDRQGRLWFGTGDIGERDPIGGLYRFDPDGTLHSVEGGFIATANGPAISPDGRTLYIADSGLGLLHAYDLDPMTGTAGNRRTFQRIPAADGAPDGMTVDAAGYLWNAHWGGARLTRYTPDGHIDRVVAIPVERTTSCTFGGDDLATLFVTTAAIDFPPVGAPNPPPPAATGEIVAGSLFAFAPGVRGMLSASFAG